MIRRKFSVAVQHNGTTKIAGFCDTFLTTFLFLKTITCQPVSSNWPAAAPTGHFLSGPSSDLSAHHVLVRPHAMRCIKSLRNTGIARKVIALNFTKRITSKELALNYMQASCLPSCIACDACVTFGWKPRLTLAS